MPAYIVFSDASLRDMTQRLPQTETEFLKVSGVGATKLERYGSAFLACIAEHLASRKSEQGSGRNSTDGGRTGAPRDPGHLSS
jgi:ATP-dependent DNA helicase RecQ